jgi:CHAP domain-containing protein
MANGKAPFGVDLDSSETIDDGTSARIDSPSPGPIGLDSKGGTTKQSGASTADQIVTYARRQRGSRLGDGQCFTLADRALRGANARSAADYGSVTPTADYTWGTSVTLADLQPGDVIQFRNYTYERVVVTEDESGTRTAEHTEDRPHHTAIVERVGADGEVTVLEQNSPEGSPVTRTQLFFTAGTTTSGNRTTTIRVRGTFWFYRPEAR